MIRYNQGITGMYISKVSYMEGILNRNTAFRDIGIGSL